MLKYLRTYSLLFQSLFILPLAHAEGNKWDWTPRAALTDEQRSQLNQYCHGAYVNSWQASNNQDTNLAADLIVRSKNGVIYLEGAAEIIQPQGTLSADQIKGVPNEYYQAEGNVTLRNKDQLIRSASSYISDNGNNAAVFNDAKFLNHETGARIEAKSLSHDQSGVVFIEEGFFTTCEPNDESWKLYGSSIELDSNSGFGTAKHVQVHIANIPVFYFPWLRFPLDDRRQSGFLFPNLSYSSSDGLGLSAPIYWNIRPTTDATITPNYLQHEGEGVDLEFRHLTSYGETVYEQSIFDDNEEGTQILLKLSSNQQYSDSLRSGFVFEANPTEDKYPELNTTSIGEEDNYERSIYLSFNKGNFFNKVTYLTYQTPDDSEDPPFQWLPRISSSYRFAHANVNYDFDAQYTDFYDPDEDNFDGERLVVNQDLSLYFNNSWASFSPGALIQYRDYNLHDYTTGSDSTTSLTHETHYADASLHYERFLSTNAGRWRQSLTPRLSYLNSPYEDQDDIQDFDAIDPTYTYSQAFSHSRFEGNDRIGDTEQVSLGLETRLFDENNNQRWAIKAGQVFYLGDRYVDIEGDTDDTIAIDDSERSDLLTAVDYNGDNYSLTSNLNYDLDDQSINLVQFIAKLEPTNSIEIDLSYLYSINNTDADDDAEQVSTGVIFPLNQNWSMYSQYTYDFLDDQAIRQIIGLGYEDCCMKVSFSYQDWLDDDDEFDRGVFLQFTLRSLSTAGSSNNDANSIEDTYWNQGNIGY